MTTATPPADDPTMAKSKAAPRAAVPGFDPPGFVFDELSRAAAWRETVGTIMQIPEPERGRLWERADRFVVENGTIYNAFHDSDAAVRPWNIDLFPLVLGEAEFETLEAGLTQRARLLEAIAADLYGPQTLLRFKGLPAALVYGNPSYERNFRDLVGPRDRMMALTGFEIARGPDGDWYVMADRMDAATGCGYALENRLAVARALPRTIKENQVRRLAPFFERLQLALKAAAPRNADDPRIVLLSAGPSSDSYFEDVFLARYLGFMLVQPGDLAVRDQSVYVKTIDGLLGVDVVFNRVPEAGIDPLECSQSGTGVVGLVGAMRAGTVAVVNRPGCGLLESPVWMPYLPSLCRTMLGEELLLPSIASWWCGTPEARKKVLDSLDQFVIKPAFAYSGAEEYDVAALPKAKRADLVRQIKASPEQYVAQEKIARSASPSWTRDGLGTGHVALRMFVTPTEREAGLESRGGFCLMPGALVRVATDPGPIELSISAGHSSKDAWVRSSEPVQPVTLLRSGRRPKPRRNAHLVPCRVADYMFWFGRKLDRLDVVTRLLRSVVERVDSDQPSESLPELQPLLSALVGQSLITKKEFAAIKTLAVGPTEGALIQAVVDADDTSSLRGLVRDLRRMASNLRDRLSGDTWKAVRRLDDLIAVSEPNAFLTGGGIALLDNLIAGLATCSGLIVDGTVRGAGWKFFNLGRHIGRAERTIEFLLDAWIKPRREAVPDASPLRSQLPERSAEDRERAILEAVLEVMDGRITYRSRYLADVSAALVLDLVVFDDTNPRSLAYQYAQLVETIDTLPRDVEEVGLTEPQLAVRRATTAIQLEESTIIAESDPMLQRKRTAKLLRSLSKHTKETSLATTRRYLVLSRSARERDEGVVRLA